jgi:hypothetical protein
MQLGYKQRKFDVATAFLNGKMDHLCYIETPEGTTFNLKKGEGLRLLKALYGTKQAARLWNKMLEALLLKIGFKQNTTEICLYEFKERKLFLIIYVDDISIFFKYQVDGDWFAGELERSFKLGEPTVGNIFLGMHVIREKEKLFINQERYILGMMETYGQEKAKSTNLPMAVGLELESRESDEAIGEKPYAELIGSLLYAARSTRPDISFAVSTLARYVSKPRGKHYKAAIKVLQFI